ncbi:MAG: zinc ABC transporter substrate-binding protein [Chloroflexi bacterium]|nr:zinc ABC transporter substrate-binding protein [Chloroflexota bacterium]
MLARFRWIAFWALAVWIGGCQAAAATPPPADRLVVVASIAPLADLVRQVGGDQVAVTQMVPLGSNPHTFEPTPAQMRAVSQAQLLVLNGAGLEPWAEDVIQAAENPDLQVLVLAEGLPLLDRNPHLWLNPRYMMQFTDKVAAALADLDPEHAADYRQRAAAYRAELERLDADIRAALAQVPSRKVVTLHAAWDYFAQEYGLEVVAVIEPTPGREPSPAEVAALVELIRREQVPVIIVESQPTPPVARVLADETGARVVYLEPLGGPPPLDTYLGLMRANVQTLVDALRGGP